MSDELESQEGEETEGQSSTQLDLFVEQARKQGEQIDQKFDALISELRQANQKPASAQKPEKDEKTYTAAELQPLIDDGKITMAQAAEYLAETRVKAMRDELRSELRKERETAEKTRTVADRIAEYRRHIPELADKQSDAFARASEEYKALVLEDGRPQTAETELEALRLAFGRDPAKRRSAPRETTAERTRSVESSGSGAGRTATRRPANTDGWPDHIDARRRAWYEKQIERGMYKGVKDPKLQKEFEIIKRKESAA